MSFHFAQPFPHTVLDDWWPEEMLDNILGEWPADDDPRWDNIATKRTIKKSIVDKGKLGPNTQDFYESLSDSYWIQNLESLADISGLALGYAGLHYSQPGGYMKIHKDFNWHPQLELQRSLNVHVFLGQGWKPEHGGELELWDADMTKCVQKISPIHNRTVIMRCSETSFHGHPDPQHGYRKSFYAYYFSPGKPDDIHGTRFQNRGKS